MPLKHKTLLLSFPWSNEIWTHPGQLQGKVQSDVNTGDTVIAEEGTEHLVLHSKRLGVLEGTDRAN